MGPARMLRSLQSSIQAVFPKMHLHQIKGLAAACDAMVRAEHCQLSRMGVATRGKARPPSSERRFQRLIANPRIDTRQALDAWGASSLANVRKVTLLLDETPRDDSLDAMKLSRQVGGRAIPLFWECYASKKPPGGQVSMVMDMLQRADAALPDQAKPTLLADRGFGWPKMVDFCREHDWHFVLRIQCQTRVKMEDGRICKMSDLTPKPGSQWFGSAHVFKKAGWRYVNIVAYWDPGEREPWLLITDLSATRHRCQQYRKRMRQEQAFRDEKSSGFRWRESRVNIPEHAQRLLLIMAIATAWLLWMGGEVIKRGKRMMLERRDRRTLSLFQLGLRWMIAYTNTDKPPPCPKCVGR